MSEPAFMATWRADHYSCKPVIYMHKPAVLLACRVNDSSISPSSPPILSIFYDSVTAGSYTNVREGHLLLAGSTPGAADLGRTFVKNISSSIINVPRTSRGNKDGELDLADNVYLTVLDLQILAVKNPFISTDFPPVTYKYSDEPVGSYGSTFPPIANPGPPVLDYVDTGTNLLTVPFVDYSDPQQGTITAWLWEFGSGATPSTSTAQNPGNVTFPPGARYVYLKVTCSNGLTHTAHVPVVALEATGTNAPLSAYDIKYVRRLEGSTLEFKTRASIPKSTYVDGTYILAMVQETFTHDRTATLTDTSDSIVVSDSAFAQVGARVIGEGIPDGTTVIAVPDATHIQLSAAATATGAKALQFIFRGSLSGPAGRKHMLFYGWHKEDSGRSRITKGRVQETTVKAVDALGRLANSVHGFPQIMERDATPIRWEQQAGLNIDTYEHSLGYWHSRLYECADYVKSGLGASYPIITLGSGGSSLYEQMDKRAKAVKARLTIDRFSRLRILQDPFLLNPADRTTTIQATLGEGDWNAEEGITIARNPEPRSYFVRESAVLIGTEDADTLPKIGTAFCVLPGLAPGWGNSESEIGEQLAIDSDDLLDRAKHRRARGEAINNQFDVKLIHAGECGIEPGLLEWINFTLSSLNMAQRNVTFNADRFWVSQLVYTFNEKNLNREAVITIEGETVGVGGYNIIQEEAQTPAIDSALLPTSPTTLGMNKANLLPKGSSRIGLVNTDGYIYLTQTFNKPAASGGPVWTRVSGSVSGTVITFVVDAFSPYYINGSGTVDGWIVTSTGLYKVTDLAGTPSASLQLTFRASNTRRSIQSSFGGRHLIVASAYTDGVYRSYCTDGSTWSSETLSGSSTVISGDAVYPGVHASHRTAGLTYLSAYLGSTSADGYKSTDYGAAIAALGTPDVNPGERLAGDIHVPYGANNENIVFHGKKTTTTAEYPMTTANLSHWSTVGGTPDFANNRLNSIGLGYYGEVIFYVDNAHSLFTVTQVYYDYFVSGYPGVYGLVNIHVSFENSSDTVLAWVDHTVNYTNFTYFGYQGSANWTGSYANVHHVRFKVYQSYGPQWYLANIKVGTSLIENQLIKVVSTTKTNVGPAGYGPWKGRQLDSSPVGQSYMAAALGNDDLSLAGIWKSASAGAAGTWTPLVAAKAAGSRYEHVAISGDGKNVVYVFGTNGVIGVSENFSTVDSRLGNLSSFTPGEHVGIFGW